MSDLAEKMGKAASDQVQTLARVRRISELEAAHEFADSCRANLADSEGTTMGAYWRLMLSVVERDLIPSMR